MTDTPDPQPAAPAPPPGFRFIPRKRIDPAAMVLVGAGIVLVLAVVFLWMLPSRGGDQAARAEALERRLAALEATPRAAAPALGPLEQRLAGLERATAALAAAEQRIATLEGRPSADPRMQEALAGRLAAVEPRLAEILSRPAPDAAAIGQLVTRADRLAERQDALGARQQAAETEAARRAEEVARVAGERLAAAQQAQAQRVQALEAAQAQRIAALEAALGQRLAALEQGQQRLAALEERARRMTAYDSLAALLEAGQALGPALGGVPNAPAALTRFAQSAPPTEAALRLAFEDAARAARAAGEPAREGQGVAQSALARLSGLITVRRGEEVVWGDAASAEIERARRALEAGDIEGALARLARLPPPMRDAMRGWTDQAQALVAARAALRTLAAG